MIRFAPNVRIEDIDYLDVMFFLTFESFCEDRLLFTCWRISKVQRNNFNLKEHLHLYRIIEVVILRDKTKLTTTGYLYLLAGQVTL